ncbi:hypothetical protein SRABI26_04254 [Arthrobacter sp. Bi26]|nr:hypothetical protein SRABI26_04254 [Arthrobacter sp. Bi26]
MRQLALDGVDGSDDARIIRREEPHPGQQQETGVQLGPPVGLHECVAFGVEPVGHDLGVDSVTQLFPAVGRAGQAEVPDPLDHAVRRHPCHHLGVREVALRAAHFPQPVIRPAPGCLEVFHEGHLDVPGVVGVFEEGVPGQGQAIEHLAPDIELQLAGRAVPGTHRGGVFIALQPRQFELRQPAFTVEAVHDLQIRRVPGDGPEQPVAPRAGLLRVARGQQRLQGEGGVAQPAEAVVPVPGAADLLRQGRRDGGNNAPGGGEGQGFERDQRALDGVTVRPGDLALRRPAKPELLGGGQDRFRVH